MWRGLLTSALAVTLAATLLWGGCVSCRPVSQTRAATGCCDTAGKCKAPAPQEPSHRHCASSSLATDQYQQAAPDLATQFALQPAPVPDALLPGPVASPAPLRAAAESPPDLFLLHSTFRI